MSARYSCKEASCEVFAGAELAEDGSRIVSFRRMAGNLMLLDGLVFEDMKTSCAELSQEIEELAIDDAKYRSFLTSEDKCPVKFLEALGVAESPGQVN